MTSTSESATALPAAAVLTDPASGLVEEIGYFGGTGPALYGVLHRAAGQATTGLVVAPPFLMEFQRNYRREVLVAKEAAARGLPTLRFSYRGVGHSGGDTAELGFAAAVDDTVAAVESLRTRTGVERVVVVGTRLAVIVGAAAAGRCGVGRLVGWDPVVSGSAWVKELSRAAKVQAMRDEETAPGSIEEHLEQRGETEVLGSSLFPALHDGLAELGLVEACAAPLEVLLVQFGKPDRIKKATSTAAAELEAAGHTVTVAGVDEEESWWATRRADYFQAEPDRTLTKELIPLTLDWIEGGAG